MYVQLPYAKSKDKVSNVCRYVAAVKIMQNFLALPYRTSELILVQAKKKSEHYAVTTNVIANQNMLLESSVYHRYCYTR